MFLRTIENDDGNIENKRAYKDIIYLFLQNIKKAFLWKIMNVINYLNFSCENLSLKKDLETVSWKLTSCRNEIRSEYRLKYYTYR